MQDTFDVESTLKKPESEDFEAMRAEKPNRPVDGQVQDVLEGARRTDQSVHMVRCGRFDEDDEAIGVFQRRPVGTALA